MYKTPSVSFFKLFPKFGNDEKTLQAHTQRFQNTKGSKKNLKQMSLFLSEMQWPLVLNVPVSNGSEATVIVENFHLSNF